MRFVYLSLLLFPCFLLAEEKVDFNTQIKSILSNKCIACHGPDEENREAGLRLDTFDGATEDLGGYAALIPGGAQHSEMIFRMGFDPDDEEIMPPECRGDPLTEEEIELFSRWINQGGEYDKHWSYKKPVLTRALIEAHRDKKVVVYGNYAVIKLPITKGVVLWNPVAITKDSNGVIYAANYTGEIYSLYDSDKDGLEDTAKLFCDVKKDNLRYPTSLVFKGKDLYVGCTQEIRVYSDSDGDGQADKSRTFFKDFPWTLDQECWTFGLCFGPDGCLYFNLTTDTYSKKPAADPKKMRGAVMRLSPDGKKIEVFATGIRFSPGMAFNDVGDLFLSDNRGNQNRYEEINHIEKGKFYGNNPRKYEGQNAVDPLVKVKHGVASGGMRFNRANNHFGGTARDLFMACWGTNGRWDRGELIRVKLFKMTNGSYKAKEFPVITQMGKIIDLVFSDHGDLYVAKFGREYNMGPKGWHEPWPEPEGGIYRVVYAPWVKAQPFKDEPKITGDIAKGKLIYTQRACQACHAIDNKTESFGPNLGGIRQVFSSKELQQEIQQPGTAIQVGFEKYVLTKKDKSLLEGRLIYSDDKKVTLMMVGNAKVTVNRRDIASLESTKTSMMPAGLLGGLSQKEINHLLAYLQSLD